MMKRAEITMGMVISLVLLAIVTWIIVAKVAPFLQFSGQADKDFSKLTNALTEFDTQTGGDQLVSKSLVMRLDKGTYIVGFNKASSRIIATALDESAGETVTKTFTFEKPKQCKKGESCVCRCTEFSLQNRNYTCTRSACVEYTFNIASWSTEYHPNKPKESCAFFDLCLNEMNGGFIIGRGVAVDLKLNREAPRTGTLHLRFERSTRTMSVCNSVDENNKCPNTEAIKLEFDVFVR